MILDESEIVLFPGNEGKDCPGNGTNIDKNGIKICLCDECDYMICCTPEYGGEDCKKCPEEDCPRKAIKGIENKSRIVKENHTQ